MKHLQHLIQTLSRRFFPWFSCLCLGTFLLVACTGTPSSPGASDPSITPSSTATPISQNSPTPDLVRPASPDRARDFITMCENRVRLSEGVRNLITVMLTEVKQSDCRGAVPALQNLVSLNLDGTPLSRPDGGVSGPLTDLRPLLICQRLREINFYGQDLSKTDLTPLNQLAALEDLNLTDIDVKKLAFLKPMKQMRSLGLRTNQIVDDFSTLAGLANLRTLDIEGPYGGDEQNRPVDLSPLANLKQLEVLKIGQNQVSNLAPLKDLKQLQQLYLVNNKIVDLQPLAGLLNLEMLFLNQNQIQEVNPLASLQKLKFLDLSYNQVRDITPLAQLHELENLSLANNQIQDFSALRTLKKIDQLTIKNNLAPQLNRCPIANVPTCVFAE